MISRLYGVLTKNLNKAVKRNQERFPEDFMFRLTKEEGLRFQNGTARSNNLEAEIDEKVFDLYGLTPEEREIVKGGGK